MKPAGAGAHEEDLAAAWLQARGCRILARNFRTRRGELDLVIEDAEVLAVVEVRRRRWGAILSAAASVDRRKQARLVMATRAFLAQHPALANWPVRFDVLAFESGDQPQWIRNAFEPASDAGG